MKIATHPTPRHGQLKCGGWSNSVQPAFGDRMLVVTRHFVEYVRILVKMNRYTCGNECCGAPIQSKGQLILL